MSKSNAWETALLQHLFTNSDVANVGDATGLRGSSTAGSLYFIFNGEVEVSIDADSGRRLRLTTLGPGCVFGEVALLNGQPRSADVHAIVDTQCLEVAFDDLQGEVRNKVMINLARYFAQKIQRDTGLVQHLG